MTTFKKLDEYLKDAKYNIVDAIANSLGIDAPTAQDLYRNINQRQEIELVYILDDEHTTNNEKTQLVDDFFRNLGLLEDDNQFNGVDIAGDYNYKCMIVDSTSRDAYMDWLEENTYEYLIDSKGLFAIKCDSRERTYKAEQASNACKTKIWLKDMVGKNVDPTEKRKGMPLIKRSALNDSASLERSPFDTFKDRSSSASPFTADTVDGEEFDEDKKSSKRAIKKKIDARLKNVSKAMAGGENPAKALSDPQFRSKIVKDKRKFDKKKERQQKITDESVRFEGIEETTGITEAPAIIRLMALAGVENDATPINESLTDAISDLAMEVTDGADLNITANELADEYGINVNLLLRKFEEQHGSVEALINAKKARDKASKGRINRAIQTAREIFMKRFVGEPNEDVGKIFKFKNIEYAYIAFDGTRVMGTRVGGVRGKDVWNFRGPETINAIISQL